MNNKEKLLLSKIAAGQLNPNDPARSAPFQVGRQSFTLDQGPQQQLSNNPADFNFSSMNGPGGVAAANKPPAAPATGSQPLLGANGKPMVFEPSDNAVAVPPSMFNMFKGTGPTPGATAGVPSSPAPATPAPTANK